LHDRDEIRLPGAFWFPEGYGLPFRYKMADCRAFSTFKLLFSRRLIDFAES